MWNPVFDQLSEGLSRSLPMEDSELYREGGKQWFSAAPSKETLKHWFSLLLIQNRFQILRSFLPETISLNSEK